MSFNLNIEKYKQIFPNYPPVVQSNNWIYGIWMIGNYYKRKYNYHGEYPPSYLKRVYALFEGYGKVLHLFSGVVDKNEQYDETTFDISSTGYEDRPQADILGDAEKLNNYFNEVYFDLIIADPPYTLDDAERYGCTKLVNKKKVLHECYKIANDGCYLIWLDLMIPIYTKKEWKLIGTIGLLTGTNRKVRIVSIFKKPEKKDHCIHEEDLANLPEMFVYDTLKGKEEFLKGKYVSWDKDRHNKSEV